MTSTFCFLLLFQEAAALKIGDRIDLRDSIGRFVPSTLVQKKSGNLKSNQQK